METHRDSLRFVEIEGMNNPADTLPHRGGGSKWRLNAVRYTLFAARCALCALIVFTVGCATTSQFGFRNEEIRTEDISVPGTGEKLVWPPPPQTPRIQYLTSVSGLADIGYKKSWFKKAIRLLFGEEEMAGIMLRPYGVFADSNRIYVTDPGIHILHVFDIREKEYFRIKEVKDKEFVSPIGIAVDKNENIYLSDSVLKRVFMFDKEGKYLRDIGMSESYSRPTGIAVDEDRVYVVDTLGHKVLVFAKKDGGFLFSFGKNGNEKGYFNYPTNIFIGRDKLLYITDSMNFRVQIFDRDGNFISAFGKHGDGSGDFSKPKGIAVDSEDHIYVADAQFDNIQIFDRDGRLLLGFGKTGRRDGEMILPAGIFIDDKDRIYVADSYNNRIQIFQYLKDSSGQVVEGSSKTKKLETERLGD
ncbi:MAG: 6-bladed beta-propeller [Nitrospirota bacterium]